MSILEFYEDFTIDEAYERAQDLYEKGYLQPNANLDEVAKKIYENNLEKINKYRKEKKKELTEILSNEESDDYGF